MNVSLLAGVYCSYIISYDVHKMMGRNVKSQHQVAGELV